MKKLAKIDIINRVIIKIAAAASETALLRQIDEGNIPIRVIDRTIKSFFKNNKYTSEQQKYFLAKLFKMNVHNKAPAYRKVFDSLIDELKIPGIAVPA